MRFTRYLERLLGVNLYDYRVRILSVVNCMTSSCKKKTRRRIVNMHAWKYEDGRAFINNFREKAFSKGYCLAIGGSVMYAGISNKDLDIVCMPSNRFDKGMSNEKIHEEFIAWLEETFPIKMWNSHEWASGWEKYTFAVKWEGAYRLVDFFIPVPR